MAKELFEVMERIDEADRDLEAFNEVLLNVEAAAEMERKEETRMLARHTRNVIGDIRATLDEAKRAAEGEESA